MRFPAVLTPDTLGSLLRSKRFSEAHFVEDDMAGTVMVTRGGFSAGYPVRGDAANTSRIDVSYFSKGEKRRPTAAQRAKKVAAVARIAALLGQAYKVRMNPAGTSLVVTVPAAKASRSAVKHNPPVNVLYDLHTGNPLRITSMTPAFIAVAEPFSITLKQARAALENQDVQAHSAAQIMEAARTHADTDVMRRGPANRVFVRVGNEFHAVAVGTGGGSAKANGAQRLVGQLDYNEMESARAWMDDTFAYLKANLSAALKRVPGVKSVTRQEKTGGAARGLVQFLVGFPSGTYYVGIRRRFVADSPAAVRVGFGRIGERTKAADVLAPETGADALKRIVAAVRDAVGV